MNLYRDLPKPKPAPIDKFLELQEFVSNGRMKNRKTKFIFPNYQDYGYGIFLLDERSRAYVLANIQNEKDDFLRTMMWGICGIRSGSGTRAADYVELVIKVLSSDFSRRNAGQSSSKNESRSASEKLTKVEL